MAKIKNTERLFIPLVEQGILEIDDQGNIWNCRKGKRRLATKLNNHGYLIVSETIGGKHVSTGAHRLVYQHFHGLVPDGQDVNHENGVKTDNKPENLGAITRTENLRHAHTTGLTHFSGYRLTEAQVREIKQRRAAGETLVALAKSFGVTHPAIWHIVHGTHYGEVL